MVNKIIIAITIVLSLFFSCSTVKNNENKKGAENIDPLLNTCWAIDYRIMSSGDSIKMNMKINWQFMENGICNISGMHATYELKDSMLYMAGNTYKIITLSEKELKVADYWRYGIRSIEIHNRIDCDSVNEIFKGFELQDGSRKI